MPVNKKITALVIFGILIAALAIFLPEQEDIAFEYIVNNTDLYNNGRITGTTYIANDSAIQLFLIFHVIGTGASLVVDTNLSINGTVVEDRDYRTTAGAGIHEHFSMTAHIPKGANYSITNSSNLETIEWREYPILSGRNGTLSIVQGGGTGSQNLSQVLTQGNDAQGKTITGVATISNTSGYLEIYSAFFGNLSGVNFDTIGNTTSLFWNTKRLDINSTGAHINDDLNLHGNDLINCGNCGGNQNLSQVLAVGNDAKLQNITNAHDIFQEFSEINMTIDNNCEDSGAPPVAKNCPRTLQQLKTDYSNVTIRHRLNPANENYGITLNTKPDLSLDNASLTGWGVFIRSFNDDFYVGRFKPGYSEFIWRALNNDTVVFYNNVTVTKNETITGLSGTGNAYVCVDSVGKLYRGNPGC